MNRIKTAIVGSVLSLVVWGFTFGIVQLSLTVPQ